MANQTIWIEVTKDDRIAAYWVAINSSDLNLVDGKGKLSLPAGKKHVLIWWMEGNEGGEISITGRTSSKTVVEIKKSRIPSEEHQGAGHVRFEL